eukprot:2403199-Prymnesium_polylepis.1
MAKVAAGQVTATNNEECDKVNRMLMRRNLEVELNAEVTEVTKGEDVLELVLNQRKQFDAGEQRRPLESLLAVHVACMSACPCKFAAD